MTSTSETLNHVAASNLWFEAFPEHAGSSVYDEPHCQYNLS